MSGRIPCSVGILTYNNATTIERTLQAVKDFEEIVVLDGGSTDQTHELARRAGAVVRSQRDCYRDATGRIRDFAGAKNHLLAETKQPWVYVVDSDEYPDDTLTDSIAQALHSVAADVGLMRVTFRYVYRGRVIEDATNYPFRGVRLMRRDARFVGSVHEHPEHAGREVLLPGYHLLVVPLLRDTWRKRLRYLRLERARRCVSWRSWWGEVGRPRWRSFKWLAWRLTKVRRGDPFGRRLLPLVYELSKVVNEPLAAIARMPPISAAVRNGPGTESKRGER